MVTRRVTNRYPRCGDRIAPSTLREFLMEPIPKRLRGKPGNANVLLCDLDETAWDRFPAENLIELSRIIVDRVSAYHTRRIFQHRHFPRPLKGIRLDDLHLENRTRRCLSREGFEEHPEKLGDHTIGEIMSIRAFGPRCLVDLLTALESPRGRRSAEGGAAEVELSAELTSVAEALSVLPEARLARREDPRFAPLLHAVDIEATTAADLAQRLLARTQDPPDSAYATDRLRQLHGRIEGMPNLTLEQELIQIFGTTRLERNRQILIGYYGWEDGKQHTLTEIGKRFGITRERIRQVCAKLTRKPKKLPTILAPVMDRALALIDSGLPCRADELESEMAKQGLTAVGIQLEGVANGAKLLGRPVSFKIVKLDKRRLAVRSEEVNAALAIADLAKKQVYFHGLATVKQIQERVSRKFPGRAGPQLVRETLRLIDGFSWLHEEQGWFRIGPITKHGLPKVVDKILAVAGEVTVSQMRMAMSRNRRLWKNPPPQKVMLEFCRQTPGVRVEGNRIIADPPREWRKAVTGVEAKLVRVLKKYGPVMERGAMEDRCVASGMNRFSFHAFVSWSPVIEQFGHSVYGLLGSKPSKKVVEALIAKRREKRTARRVLDSHGWTDDGKVWLRYTLSKAASTYAVITIPAALKRVVQGRFKLVADDGQDIGTLATKEGRAWGLGAFMRKRSAQIGDHVVVTLDLQKRTALVTLNKRPA